MGGFVGTLFGGGDRQDGVSEHDQDGPTVPGSPGTDLVLVQTGQAFADWNDSSTVHRRSATFTNTANGTGVGL